LGGIGGGLFSGFAALAASSAIIVSSSSSVVILLSPACRHQRIVMLNELIATLVPYHCRDNHSRIKQGEVEPTDLSGCSAAACRRRLACPVEPPRGRRCARHRARPLSDFEHRIARYRLVDPVLLPRARWFE